MSISRGLPRFFFSVFIVVSPFLYFGVSRLFLWPLCGHFGAWGVPNKHLVFSLAVRRKIQCLFIFVALWRIFPACGICISRRLSMLRQRIWSDKRLHSSPHLRRSYSLTLLRDALNIITLEIVIWYGAVIAQSGRQSYENIPHKLIPKYWPFR